MSLTAASFSFGCSAKRFISNLNNQKYDFEQLKEKLNALIQFVHSNSIDAIFFKKLFSDISKAIIQENTPYDSPLYDLYDYICQLYKEGKLHSNITQDMIFEWLTPLCSPYYHEAYAHIGNIECCIYRTEPKLYCQKCLHCNKYLAKQSNYTTVYEHLFGILAKHGILHSNIRSMCNRNKRMPLKVCRIYRCYECTPDGGEQEYLVSNSLFCTCT